MFGSEYFFEHSTLETVDEDPTAHTSGRVWFNLKTKEFKISVTENNKIVVKILPIDIVLYLLIHDLTHNSSILNPIENITQIIIDNPVKVPSSKAVYEALNKIKFKNYPIDGLSLVYTFNHNLDSTDLQIFVYDLNNNVVYPNIKILNSNSVEITFTELSRGKVNIASYT